MKNKQLLFTFAFVIICLIFVLNAMQNVEPFTPSIREIYRPYARKARTIGEGFIDHHKMNISNLFRKFGIM